MVSDIGQTRGILAAGQDFAPHFDFALTVALSPKDKEALPNPTISTSYQSLIENLLSTFKKRNQTVRVFWLRAADPITAEAVKAFAEQQADKLSTMDLTGHQLPGGADSFGQAQILPTTNFACNLPLTLPFSPDGVQAPAPRRQICQGEACFG